MKRISLHMMSLLMLASILVGMAACSGTPGGTTPGNPTDPNEIEAVEFMGTALTPIDEQRSNALSGTQFIDRDTYLLTIDGLVDTPLTLSYDELRAFPQISKLMPLNCVEGWGLPPNGRAPPSLLFLKRPAYNPARRSPSSIRPTCRTDTLPWIWITSTSGTSSSV